MACKSYHQMTRRRFLGGLAAATAYSMFNPSFLLAQSSGASTGKNLILINLAGGCDGLMMFPYYEGPVAAELARIRPTIQPANSAIGKVFSQTGIPSKVGTHPAIASLNNVIASNGAIIQKYGIIANPGRSHDHCQQLMDLGTSASSVASKGFMARFADRQNLQLFQYWGFSNSAGYYAFNTDIAKPLVIDSLDEMNLEPLLGVWDDEDTNFVAETRAALIEMNTPQNAVEDRYQRALRTMDEALLTVRTDITSQTVGSNSAGNYNSSPIGNGLRDAAKVLKAKESAPSLGGSSKMTAIYLTHGGYDHHSSIVSSFTAQAGALASNLAVFINDLKAINVWNKTTIVLFSEFGRTCHENGTAGQPTVGTDHGWGSTTLVLGGSVRPGAYGAIPTVNELIDGDINALIPTTDYRDIFSEIFQWLGVPPKEIFDEPSYTVNPIGILS